jgi:hypothetical protein
MPALSVDWGVWGEAGMASQFDASAVRALADRGMGAMRTDQGLDALGRLMQGDATQTAVLPVNWQRWAELYPAYTASPFLADVLGDHEPAPTHASHDGPSHGVLHAPANQRPVRLSQYLADTLGAILGFTADDVDPAQPISALGLDSLTAVEFKNRIASDLGVSLPTVRFLQGPAITELVLEIDPLLAQASLAQARDANESTASPPADEAALLARVDELSDAEVDAALADLLGGDA